MADQKPNQGGTQSDQAEKMIREDKSNKDQAAKQQDNKKK